MSPLKKRPFSSEAPDAAPQSQLPTIDNVNSVFTAITDQIASTGTVKDVCATVLQLEEWQRRIYATLAMQESQLEEHRAKRLTFLRKNMASQYERAQLQYQIVQLQQVAIPNLEKLARQETGLLETDVISAGSNKESSSLKVVSSFLEIDVTDPSNKAQILAKLKEGYDKRASLEKDVQRKKQELSQTQLALKQKQDMLRTLPAQLAAIERASQLLGKFMTTNGKSNASTTAVAAYDGSHMAGSERLARLEKARQLPAPLYTLFSLLQHYIDETTFSASEKDPSSAQATSDYRAQENVAMKLSLVQSSTGAIFDTVVWQLPVTDVAITSIPTTSSKHKYVSIRFTYHDKPVPVVTIQTTGCAALLNQEILLDELFPGDVDLAKQSAVGKSYLWSNHLAGLYQIPIAGASPDMGVASISSSDRLHASTRVVIHELQRRIRANATLKHILFSLQRLRVPVPPAFPTTNQQVASYDTAWKPMTCKLGSFSTITEDVAVSIGGGEIGAAVRPSGVTTFQLELRCGTKALYATMQLHTARYPAIPPVWCFRTSKKDDTNPPLYDSQLEQLSHKVNVDTLHRLDDKYMAGSDLLAIDEEFLLFYEWILIHQLREIMLLWDNWSSEHNSVDGDGGRIHKGRDRKTA